MRHLRVKETGGFTRVEVRIVVLIITILAVMAIPVFHAFLKKAKMVEGETMMTEIQQLETSYFADNSRYTDNFQDLTFNTATVHYYTSISIQIDGNDPLTGNPILYQVTATANLDSDPDLDAWVLTMDMDGNSTIQHGCIPGGVGTVQLGCTD